MNFLILGSGPAGIFAAETVRRRDKEATIKLVTSDERLALSPVLLTYWMTGKFHDDELSFRESFWQQKKRIDVFLNKKATSLDSGNKKVILSDGQIIPFDHLLIATGSLPISLPIPGINGEGVHTLRTLYDAKQILKGEKKNKEIVIIGGGPIGLKLACHLKEKSYNIWILEKESRLAPRIFDDKTSFLIQNKLMELGIKVETGVEVVEILTNEGKVYGVHLKDGRKILCQKVIQAVGVRPNIEFLIGSGIQIDNGILVNEKMETNLPNIYAAGDVTVTIDPITSERVNHATWSAATRQGIVAGINMAGGSLIYKQNFLLNSLNLLGLHVMVAGHGYLNEEKGIKVKIKENRGNYRKIVLKDDKVIGFILVGDTSGAGFLLSLMKKGELRSFYKLPPYIGFEHGFIFKPFINFANKIY